MLSKEQIVFPVSNDGRLAGFYNLMLLLGDGILNYDGSIGQALITLSDYLGLRQLNNLSSLTLAWDKKFFLRDQITNYPVERWDLRRLGLGQEWETCRQEIMPLLRNTGLLAPRYPRYDQYDLLIIHGARLEDVEPRLKFIAQFWQQGGRFEKIIVLTGERELSEDEIGPNSIGIDTEFMLMQSVWQEDKIIPREIKQLPIYWVNTPNFKDENGRLRRGVTEDTINMWLDTKPSEIILNDSKCLVVANAPLILRQNVVFERVFLERGIDCHIETVGLAETKEGSQLIIYYLREIAGLLWEIERLAQTENAGVHAFLEAISGTRGRN